ncbi:ribonuclease P protein component [Isoptericola sp. S6320L]|uniref:ribonuclease P protein component n=1 Tax=Isoptericola sp. S6320L TaxID=2926411 RepID=UPI001FF338DC|nr:ribonuclease P protein component [Isoptericola sp. S6320L]MCK0116024.1 ribonuclease P protein component [Isoptericola sp. S6320L]
MLPAARRMRRSFDFERAVRGGARAGRSTVVVHLTRKPGQVDGPLVGLVVSKAVGNAVHRNLVKRRLRGVAAAHLDDLPDDALMVLRALPASAEAGYARLDRDVSRGMHKALARVAGPG